VRSAAVSHRGDLLVVGVDAAQGAPNLLVIVLSGKVVLALQAETYREPIVRFSDDGEVVIVSAWFSVGVVRRSGAIPWGLTRDSSGKRWQLHRGRRRARGGRAVAHPSGCLPMTAQSGRFSACVALPRVI